MCRGGGMIMIVNCSCTCFATYTCTCKFVFSVRSVPRAQSQTARKVVGHLRQCWSHPLSRLLRSWWRVIVVALTPLLLLPLPILLKDDVRNTHVHLLLYDNIVSSFLIHWTTHCIQCTCICMHVQRCLYMYT